MRGEPPSVTPAIKTVHNVYFEHITGLIWLCRLTAFKGIVHSKMIMLGVGDMIKILYHDDNIYQDIVLETIKVFIIFTFLIP